MTPKEILETVLPENINEYQWLTTGNLREKLEALVLAGMKDAIDVCADIAANNQDFDSCVKIIKIKELLDEPNTK